MKRFLFACFLFPLALNALADRDLRLKTNGTFSGGAVDLAAGQLKIDGVPVLSTFADGDKGDVTVSGTGSVFTIDAGTVTLSKMANIATATFIGRSTAGTGVPQALSISAAKTLLAMTISDVASLQATLDGKASLNATNSFTGGLKPSIDGSFGIGDATHHWGNVWTIGLNGVALNATSVAYLNNSSPSAWRTSLGVVIGTNVQAYNAQLAQIAALADPNEDRILFWDDSLGAYAHLKLGSNLTIAGDTLNASSGTTGLGAFSEWNAKGDLIAGTADNTAAIVSVGANDSFLMADSAQTPGLKWGTPSTVRTALGLVVGTNVQAYDPDLSTLAAVNVNSFSANLLSSSDAATFRSGISAQAGLQFQNEGTNLGTANTATTVNCVGTAIDCTRVGNAITITTNSTAPSVATDALFDAKGDLLVGTADNTGARLGVGANNTILLADSAQTTGMKWGTSSQVRSAIGLATTDSAAFSDVTVGGGVQINNGVDHYLNIQMSGDGFPQWQTDTGPLLTWETDTITANRTLSPPDATGILALTTNLSGVSDVTHGGTNATTAAAARTNLGAAPLYFTENAQTGTTYTLVIGDDSKLVSMSNASSNTLTVPPNSSVAFPVGTRILVEQGGAGTSTIAAGAGVTIQSRGSLYSLAGQYAGATLIKKATNTWLLIGDLQ